MSPEDPREAAPGAPLSSDELERVIRRAAELQTVRETLPDSLDDDEVIRIGAEVGLEERHLRRALLEVRAESLIPRAPVADSLPDRLWGEAWVQVSRVVPGTLDDVQGRLDGYLRAGESLRQVRDRPGFTIWEPASDIMSQLRRGLNVGGHGYALAGARRLEVAVRELEEGRSLVTISADLRNQRTEHASLWHAGAVGAAGGVSAALVFGFLMPPLLVVPVVAGGSLGGATLLARRTLATRRERIELAVQGLLDRLERGGRLPQKSGLMDRIQDLIGEVDEF